MKIAQKIVAVLPERLQQRLRNVYWRHKSEFLYHRLYQWPNLNYRVKSGLVLRVASRGEWWVYNELFVNGEYDLPIVRALLAKSGAGALTVLDLGANVGFFFMRVMHLIRERAPHRLCDATLVEGNPRTYRELLARLKEQGLDVSPRAVNGLVGKRDGSAVIKDSALHVKNTIMESNLDGITVAFTDLDRLMQEKAEIDLLKCDIEGAEQLFLENYPELLLKVRFAVFEFHHAQCDTARCTAMLESAGFRHELLSENSDCSVNFFTRL